MEGHERTQVIEELVEPAGLEGGAVSALVPARVRRRVDGAEHQEGGDRPPAPPRQHRQVAAAGGQGDPQPEVPQGRDVAALHEGLQLAAGDVGVPPRLLDAGLELLIVERDRTLGTARQAVVACSRPGSHRSCLPFLGPSTPPGAGFGVQARPRAGAGRLQDLALAFGHLAELYPGSCRSFKSPCKMGHRCQRERERKNSPKMGRKAEWHATRS